MPDHHFRTSPRPQISCQVEVRRDGDVEPARIISYTQDISSGGMFIVTPNVLPTGESVEVVLSTPSTWEPLTLRASVAWRRAATEIEPAGIGLQFVELSPDERIALADFVASLDFEA
jgi:uncharacterized protein (TIGR02266 family)